jgi:hypothetical protein
VIKTPLGVVDPESFFEMKFTIAAAGEMLPLFLIETRFARTADGVIDPASDFANDLRV